jgi:hypothetical protein
MVLWSIQQTDDPFVPITLHSVCTQTGNCLAPLHHARDACPAGRSRRPRDRGRGGDPLPGANAPARRRARLVRRAARTGKRAPTSCCVMGDSTRCTMTVRPVKIVHRPRVKSLITAPWSVGCCDRRCVHVTACFWPRAAGAGSDARALRGACPCCSSP